MTATRASINGDIVDECAVAMLVIHECPRRIAILDDHPPTDVIVHSEFTVYEKLRKIAATLDQDFAIQTTCFSGNSATKK